MLFSQLRSHSLMDRTLACGAGNAGSIPAEGTRQEKSKSFGSPRNASRLICIQFWWQKRIHDFAFWGKKIF